MSKASIFVWIALPCLYSWVFEWPGYEHAPYAALASASSLFCVWLAERYLS